ncbi:MAG TPA: aldo/keto reductase [Alphaproteobacteria bacterium]|jgi:aryl-alcohol dehydrogenase-like predicted oxidoreductase|nr:aldo/keto reductase [Alphaproteobacteria bacterium]
MELRPLGSTGLMVSPLGLGTTKFGRTEQVKYPQAFALPDDGQVRDLLALAREHGINLIDTAPAYGSAEERLGALLPQPDTWVIVTKAGEDFADGRSHFDFSPAAVRASVERSRRRLRRDRLDVVLLHSDGNDYAALHDSGAIDTLMELKLKGHVAAIGASTKTVSGGLLAAAVCDVVMVTLNADYRGEVPVVQAAMRTGRGVLVKKPIASGHAADPAASLAAVVREPGVSSAIVGTIDPVHLRQNCDAVERALRRRATAAAGD